MTAFEEDMNTTERALSGKSASAASIFLQTAWVQTAWVGRTHRAYSLRRSALGGDVEQVAS